MANTGANSYFDYLGRTRPGTDDVASRLGNIEQALGITAPGKEQGFFGMMGAKTPIGKKTNEGSGKSLNRIISRLKEIGFGAVEDIQKSEAGYKESAPEYAQYLSSQVTQGRRTPQEAADLMADFGIKYNIPDAFKTATQLGGMTAGTPTQESVARYRPFLDFASKTLGVDLSEQEKQETEAAARSMGKTSPEEFSQFLGQKLMTDPRYISKNAIAAFANAPFEGRYGLGEKTATGEYTGRFRFQPPTTVQYS